MKPNFLWREIRHVLAPVVLLLVSQITCYILWRRSVFLLLASGCAAFSAFVFHFFRNPDRRIPDRGDVLLAPADGRVLSVESGAESPAGEGLFWRIVIFLSLWDVHVNRVPVSGRVDRIDYLPGGFLPAFSMNASRRNEQNVIRIRTDKGPVVLKQVAGLFARRIVCDLHVNQEVKAGQRFGMIKFGSRVELFIPDEWKTPGSKLPESPLCHEKDNPVGPVISRNMGTVSLKFPTANSGESSICKKENNVIHLPTPGQAAGHALAFRFNLRIGKGCRIKAGETLIGEWTHA
jgi:phosphatidylserine decarboxylase